MATHKKIEKIAHASREPTNERMKVLEQGKRQRGKMLQKKSSCVKQAGKQQKKICTAQRAECAQ